MTATEIVVHELENPVQHVTHYWVILENGQRVNGGVASSEEEAFAIARSVISVGKIRRELSSLISDEERQALAPRPFKNPAYRGK